MLSVLAQSARRVHPLSWGLLAGAVVLLTVFAFKIELVPVDREFSASWGNAQWIGVAGSGGSVGYFRKTISLDGQPNNAFLQVQASQSYSIYVNGIFIDKTRELFLGGHPDLANIYDLGPLLRPGQNTLAACALNYDSGTPMLRAVMGLAYGRQRSTVNSDLSWHATSDPQLVKQSCGLFGRTARTTGTPVWTQVGFDDSRWPEAVRVAGVRDATLPINPRVYQTPMPDNWSLGSAATDSFFYSTVDLSRTEEAWLRLCSSSTDEVYINGHLVVESAARIATSGTNPPPRAASVTAGIFDFALYFHQVRNQLVVHATTLTSRSAANDPKSRPTAISADLLAGGRPDQLAQILPAWKVSTEYVPGWTLGRATDHWPNAVEAARAVFSARPVYRVVATSLEKVDFSLALQSIALSLLLLIVACSAAVAGRCWRQHDAGPAGIARAVDSVALAFTGTVGLGILLLGLKLEPLVPRPFPYTLPWLLALVALPVATYATMLIRPRAVPVVTDLLSHQPDRLRIARVVRAGAVPMALIALVCLGAYMVTYQLAYESFWQDELSSIYAAIGVLQSGVPHLASGFIYTKAELFSYFLAGFMAIFGQESAGPRVLSVVEYLVSLPVTFLVGRYFFGKKVGLLAAALVVFSPLALIWARSARMYQQSELAVLIVMYLLYRACQPASRPRYIYLSMAAVVAMYLSHEESFIFLPAVILYFFATQRLSWIRNVHWWTAGLGAASIILAQLLLAAITHPPILGNDATQRPMVDWTPENFDFYMPLLLDGGRVMAHAFQFGWTSLLAIIVCVAALFSRERPLRFVSLFFAVPLLVLIFFFSLNADRYLYPLFPALAFLAAVGVVRTAEAVGRAARRLDLPAFSRRLIVTGFATLAVVAVLQSQVTPLTWFGLAASRTLGLDYRHRYPDYQAAGTFIRAHWQPGDVLITVAPSIEGIYYAEQPDYMIYQGKALYLYEKNNHIIDTLGGSEALLNGRDLAAALSKAHRTWLLSTSYYRSTLPRGFRPVFEGQQTLVFFRDGVNPSQAETMPFVPITPGA